MDFRSKIAQFFYGRYIFYGIDLLSKTLAVVCIILSVINLFVSSIIIYLLETALFIWMFFRLFSKNITKRQNENRKLTALLGKVKGNFDLKKRMRNEKDTHIYKKCPHCSVMLRLPRRPGEHTVKCPRCKNSFNLKVR